MVGFEFSPAGIVSEALLPVRPEDMAANPAGNQPLQQKCASKFGLIVFVTNEVVLC